MTISTTPSSAGSHTTSSSSWSAAGGLSIAAGDQVLFYVATDNIATADGASSTHTDLSGSGLTWTKVGEYTASSGAAADGVTISAWLSDRAKSAFGTLNFTVTFSSEVAVKVAGYQRITADLVLSVDAVEYRTNYATSQYGSMTTGSLPSKERLYVRASAGEYGASTNATATDGTWTVPPGVHVGSTTSGVMLRREWKTATSTGETSAFTQNIAIDSASIFIALSEDDGGAAGAELDGDAAASVSAAGALDTAILLDADATASATAAGALASATPTVAITSFSASGADLVIEYSYTLAGSSPLLTASLERDGTPIANVTTSSITGTLTITDPGAGVYALTLLDLTDSGGTDTDGPWGSTVTILGAAAALAGDAGASALASGLLGASEVPLAGAAILTGTAAGSLTTAVQMAAQALAGGQAVGDLSTAIQLGGAAVSAVVSAGELTAQIRLDGAALAAALASGALTTGEGLEGAATASAQAAGSLTTLIVLQGAAVGSVLAAADLSTASSGLQGAATAGASATGALTTAIPLVGGAQVSVIASGSTSTTVSLAGAAVASVAVSGDLVIALELSGAALAAAIAGADLSTAVVMRADAVVGAQASGTLAGVVYIASARRTYVAPRRVRLKIAGMG